VQTIDKVKLDLHIAHMCDLCVMKYEEWRKRAKRFVAMTGCTIRYNVLLPYFKEAYDEYFPNHV
jgi:hypothetical protein